MAQRGFFITGTDTDAGKTLVACTLAQQLRLVGERVAVAKPIAAGAELLAGELRNDDALALRQAAGDWQRYEDINPICFAEAIAPHIAARGRELSVSTIHKAMRPALEAPADTLLVEGAGGWYVPLNDRENLSDLAVKLDLPVILVVGIKLGCLNHAMLSAQAIESSGLTLAGWVGSVVQPGMPALEENIETLKQRLIAPCCGVLSHLAGACADDFAGQLTLPLA